MENTRARWRGNALPQSRESASETADDRSRWSARPGSGGGSDQPNTTRLEAMGAIDTEDAARRLARVILSDIDLYGRERPKPGESREAQIEEGRRLFASRVTPELVPLFAQVVADRAAGRVDAPPVAPALPTPAVAAPAQHEAPVRMPPPAREVPVPVPVLTAHVPIPRLLAVVSVVTAAVVAVLLLFR